MHRFQSSSTILRLRFAALLVVLKTFLVPTTGGLLIYSLAADRQKWIYLSLGMVGLTLVVIVLQWMVAARTRCPLCMTPVLATKACSKHRKAKRLFGSYRLKAALSMLTLGYFYCPYCNEPSVLEVRARNN